MTKQISSLPEAIPFRSVVSTIIVLLCIFSFLYFSNHLSEKAQLIARDQVITEIKYSLAMLLYDFTIEGKQDDLVKYKQANPFIVMGDYRAVPQNYHGEVSELDANARNGWYFEQNARKAVYVSGNNREYYFLDYSKEEGGVGRLILQIDKMGLN